MSKDEWIQKAKALLFGYQCTNQCLCDETEQLLAEAGGFYPGTETASSPLRWEASEKPCD